MKGTAGRDMTRKDEILDAARRCFARHGFTKTTLDDIAQVVGMKTGSLYHYYDSKETMFRDVITHEAEEMLGWLEGEVAKEKTPTRKILRYTKARLDYFRKVTNLLDVSINVIIEVTPLVDRLYRGFLDQEISLLTGVIKEGVGAGHFKQCNSRGVAIAILTISDAVKLKAFHTANALTASDVDYSSVDTEVNYIVKLILAGITRK